VEFWLIDGNNKQKLRLPVPPAEFSVESGHTIDIVDVNDFGEYSRKGDNKLDRIAFKSFFPAQYYPFCQYRNFPKPYDFVKIIEVWEHNNIPFRLLITNTNINKSFFIETFTYGERAGSRDVDFELSLVEYRPLKTTTSTSSSNSSKKTTARTSPAPPKPKTHTVVAGDTLWAIARKYYGDPYKWTEIKSKNNIKDERKLQIGKVLVLP
jgi:LysM repeat protein